jgi:hypothetical protein
MASSTHSNPSPSSLSDWVEASDPAQQVTVLPGSDVSSDSNSSDDNSTTSHEDWIDQATTDTIRDKKIAELEQELHEKADAIDTLKQKLRLEKDHFSRTIAQHEQAVKASVDILARDHAADLAALNRDSGPNTKTKCGISKTARLEITKRNSRRWIAIGRANAPIGHVNIPLSSPIKLQGTRNTIPSAR